VGLATHKVGRGEVRLGLSATAASAVLYGAVVLFGVVSASPSALGSEDGRGSSVVLVPAPHDSAGTGPAQRLPQVSPGSVRHLHRGSSPRSDLGGATAASLPRPAGVAPTPAAPSPKTARPSSPFKQATTPPATTTAPALPISPDSILTTVTTALPPLPELPGLPAPPVPPLPPLPAVPGLPALPSLP
jgi:hypothetical protein